MLEYWHLFVAFLRAGIFGYGGGPGSIPLIKVEVVDRFNWLTEPEFAEALAFGNALPGPIATKLAAYVGFKVAGPAGAGTALVGIVAPTAIAMVALFQVFLLYRDAPWMDRFIRIVKPVVVVLLFQVTADLARVSFPGWTMVVVAGLAAVGVFWLEIHPAILIALALLAGILLPL